VIVPGVTLIEEDGDRSLPAVVARAGRLFGDHPFLLSSRSEPGLTFAEFDALTDRVAAGLAPMVGPGDHVGLFVPTSNQAAAAVFAVSKAGAVPVLLPNRLRGQLLADTVRSMLGGACPVIAPGTWHGWLPLGTHALDLDDLVRAPGKPRWRVSPPAPGDLAAVLPTSGTTGAAKGVLLPHGHGVHYAECTIAMRQMRADDGVHGFAALFHVDGLYGNVLAALIVGARVALSYPVAVSRFWDVCRRQQLTTFAYAGGLVALLGAQPVRPDDADNPVRIASGAPSPPTTARAFERRFGVRLVEGYGSTEVGIPLIAPVEGSRIEDGSCGRAVTGYDVRLADDGELLVRPHEASFVMLGYLGNAEATARRWPGDGWFHTGDLLEDIGDGHFAFRGRKEDVIRRRGEFISPVTIERVALAHPGVVDVAAYGVACASREAGEQDVRLAVVWDPALVPDMRGLAVHLGDQLPPVAVPSEIHVLADFPRSAGTGKVQKHRLPGMEVT